MGQLVRVLTRLEKRSGAAPDVDGVLDDGVLDGVWRGVMDDPRTDDIDIDSSSAPSTSAPLQESDHELLPEYAFPDCTSACSALVLGLGESSTLAPLTRLFKAQISNEANADVPDDDFSERRLVEKIRVASALRVVLGCVESAGL